MTRIERRKNLEQNLTLLRSLLPGAEIVELDKFHYRIKGGTTVDYWPSTNRAWVTGTRNKSFRASVSEVAALVLQ